MRISIISINTKISIEIRYNAIIHLVFMISNDYGYSNLPSPRHLLVNNF